MLTVIVVTLGTGVAVVIEGQLLELNTLFGTLLVVVPKVTVVSSDRSASYDINEKHKVKM